jgi:pSer/pThr/pTyr-binding forkhead associated (FHA) protein
MLFVLHVVRGTCTDGRTVLRLVPGTASVLGRAAGCDVSFEDSGVSREHCRIVAEASPDGGPARCYVQDLASSAGTTVDARSLSAGQVAEAPPGSVIRLGKNSVKLEVTLVTDPDEIAALPTLGVQTVHAPRKVPVIPNFVVGEKLGGGGIGVVWRARRSETGEELAIKTVDVSAGGGTDDEILRVLKMFGRGVNAFETLGAHPHLVPVFESGSTPDHLFLVMELVGGGDLMQRTNAAAGGKLAVDQALHWCMQALEGLAIAHRADFVHRDLKPENILTTTDGVAKLADFDLAKLRADPLFGKLTGSEEYLGTPCFMAPEQYGDARDADSRADVYAMGATLYYTLTGTRPFAKGRGGLVGLMSRVQTQELPRVDTLRQDVPARLADVIEQAMALNPANRPRDADALLELLRPIRASRLA